MSLKKLTRRDFIKLAGTTSLGAIIASCTPAPTAVPPTAAPTAVPATAVPKPTTAPVSSSSAASSAVSSSAAPKLGSTLVGKLEGPTIIRETAQFPKAFKEAPMLADLVKAGKLPEVAKRLPDPSDLMVIKPLKETGKYGGNWRRAFTGPADHENGNRINSADKILHFDYTGNKIVPALAKDWKVSDDGKTVTIYLRKGAKWSNGDPFTANDFMFWYEDVYLNKSLVPTPFFEFQINGKDGVMKKIDETTVAFEFPDPYPYFVYILAGSTSMGAGFATRGAFQTNGGAYCPSAYLKQFLPKYSSEEAANAKAKAAGFDNWVSYFKNRYSWALNPDCPTMTPWKTVSPINTPTWGMERNPYFWQVDTEGNQLPYIDKLTMTLAENTEVANLRAIAGEYDCQERHMGLAKLPVFLENAQKGNYTVHLDPAFNGSDMALHLGNAYEGDAEISKLIKNKDFRHALSMGIDRDQLNEAFWLGVGTPGSTAPAPDTLYAPGPEWNKKWATLDLKQSNDILDKLGYTKKDSEGYRQRLDGKGRLRLEMVTVPGSFVPYTPMGEMIKQQWKKIGIDVDIKETERNLAFGKDANDEVQMITWANDGSEMLYLFARHALPVDAAECHMGMAYAKWFASNGKQGKKPEDPEMLRAMDLFRAAMGQKEEDQIKSAKEIWKIVVEQQWSIGVVGQSPAFMGVRIVKNNMGNVPERQVNAQHARTPCTSGPQTYFFKS
ncbi:MAG: ABC transporter substrate-binding protein [Chloroflexi bacterium]|nr:ABC transporter substrate-binding protein [Chloroflexota bacterium]